MKMFDENEAIRFIQAKVTDKNIGDEEVLDVIDAIFDYYDQSGELDLDFDENEDDSETDEAAIISYVTDALSDSGIAPSQIAEMVKAELEYEQSLL